MIKDDKICPKAVTSQEEMLAMIREVNHDFLELQEQKELLKKKVESLRERLDVLTPFQPLDLDLYKVMRYRYMKVRFGRILVDYFNRLEKYLFDDLNAVFIEGARDENYVYGCYFTSNPEASKIDSVFNSLHLSGSACHQILLERRHRHVRNYRKRLVKRKRRSRRLSKVSVCWLKSMRQNC